MALPLRRVPLARGDGRLRVGGGSPGGGIFNRAQEKSRAEQGPSPSSSPLRGEGKIVEPFRWLNQVSREMHRDQDVRRDSEYRGREAGDAQGRSRQAAAYLSR